MLTILSYNSFAYVLKKNKQQIYWAGFLFYYQSLIISIILFMHSLKNALGKQDNDDISITRSNASKTFNKSKNGSIWALDPDEDQGQQQKDKDQSKYKDFETKILIAYEKDSNFTEIGFFEIIEQIQSISQDIDQLSRLLLIEKSLNLIQTGKDEKLSTYVSAFQQCLARRIKKLKKKEKKIELQQYEKIVKTNFKKKSGAQYIDEDNIQAKVQVKKNNIMSTNGNARFNSKSIEGASSSKKNGSASSTEGKLGKLMSSGVLKEQKKQEENEQNQDHKQESVSFSAIISQSSIATRQRKTKDSKKDKKEKQAKPTQKQQQGETQGNDQAFIFYRPKANKKI